MFGLFSSSPPRRVTFDQGGVINDEVAPKTLFHNGTNIRSAGVDGVILISTDAASKITERAIGIAFDKWAETVVKDYKKEDEKVSSSKCKTLPTLPSQNDIPRKVPSNTKPTSSQNLTKSGQTTLK